VATQPHVLVAEDNELVSNAMRVLFEETGHRVSIAATIADAVSFAAADPVDLLLLDLGLADGDGLDVLVQLGERGALPRVAVALTGRDEPEIVARCRAMGCTDVLLKPVPTRELLAKARSWLASSPLSS
jgi:two-component system KDP operon response regulator KdpE